MKNKVVLVLCMFFVLAATNTYAHKEPTHQYIVREAYKLLKKLVGPIPELESHIGGTSEGRFPPSYFSMESKVVAGAWREDKFDPLDRDGFDLTVSTSHFWDADKGDNSLVELDRGFPFGFDYSINAYTKILSYLNGGWFATLRKTWTPNNIGPVRHYKEYDFTYGNLIDFYLTGDIYFHKSHLVRYNWNPFDYDDEIVIGKYVDDFSSITNGDVGTHKDFVYYILGRMCHLLADMGVPGHAHVQQHARPRDLYENSMNVEADYNTWGTGNNQDNRGHLDHTWFPLEIDVNDVFANYGGGINPLGCVEKYDEKLLHYLMYTANQLSDHYASFDFDGDDVIERDQTSDEEVAVQNLLSPANGVTSKDDYQAFYIDGGSTSLLIDVWPPSRYKVHYVNIPSVQDIRDNSFTYSIRATASLLYWFAVQTGQLAGNNCSQDLFVQNITFTQNPYTFISQNIHAGNHVDPITPRVGDDGNDAGDVIVSGSANVIFRGSSSVSLMDGFFAKPGNDGSFHAFIQDCPSPCEEEIPGVVNKGGLADALKSNQFEGEYVGVDTIDLSSSEDKNIFATITLTEDQVIDHSLSLSVHPNPATNIITLDYGLKSSGNITIGIYDQLGNLKQAIVNNQPSNEGNYSFEYNTSKYESGTYYIRISNQHKVITQQVKIVK